MTEFSQELRYFCRHPKCRSKLPKPNRPPRSVLIRNAQVTEFYGGGQWREVMIPDGVRAFVTRLWGKELIGSPQRCPESSVAPEPGGI